MRQLPEVTFVQLRYFTTAAELGSMTAASQQLHVAQSAISSAVANLERTLGLQLFIRHHARGLTLTADGERFLGEARNLLSHAAELVDSAREMGSTAAGRIAVGCFTTLAPFHLPRLLSDLAIEHPMLEVDLVEGESEGLQVALRHGRCELALMYDLGLDHDIERELLAVAPPYVILPPAHQLARNVKGIHLRDIADDPMVLLDLPHSRDYFRSLVASVGVAPYIRYRTSNYETVRALVARGHGFAILNQEPAEPTTYDGGSVVKVPLMDELDPLPIVLSRLRGQRVTARARAFSERCRAVFREQ
jgi:DNA-binding transcriptional LysR family regulator